MELKAILVGPKAEFYSRTLKGLGGGLKVYEVICLTYAGEDAAALKKELGQPQPVSQEIRVTIFFCGGIEAARNIIITLLNDEKLRGHLGEVPIFISTGGRKEDYQVREMSNRFPDIFISYIGKADFESSGQRLATTLSIKLGDYDKWRRHRHKEGESNLSRERK